MDEEKIAQGTYDFRNMRKDGYRYVDKTALLYPLVTRGMDSFFFISRPRRFGKSLMLSTLECLFRGERELFKGLAIDKMEALSHSAFFLCRYQGHNVGGL